MAKPTEVEVETRLRFARASLVALDVARAWFGDRDGREAVAEILAPLSREQLEEATAELGAIAGGWLSISMDVPYMLAVIDSHQQSFRHVIETAGRCMCEDCAKVSTAVAS